LLPVVTISIFIATDCYWLLLCTIFIQDVDSNKVRDPGSPILANEGGVAHRKGKGVNLNNVIGVLEAEIDAEGNFSEKSWDWN
jgi:hypothetical protein